MRRFAPELKEMVVSIEEVRPAERNPRRGDVDAVRESLRTHGQYKPIVARRQTSEILVGNHTWLAAKAEGWKEIAVLWRSVPDDQEAHRILLVDNRTSDLADYDEAELASLLEDLPSYDGTGYAATDVDKILASIAGALADPEPPPKPSRPKTRDGDVIELGQHRLVCGDATNGKRWDALLAGDEPAQMTWTDPPYGVDVNDIAAKRGIDHGEMAGDTRDDQGLYDLTRKALVHALAATRPGGGVYVCHADTKRAIVGQAFGAAGYHHAQTICWVKDSFVLGRQDYQWRHETILYGWRPVEGDGAHGWFGGRDQDTVVEHATRSALEELEKEELVDIAWRLLEQLPGSTIAARRPRVAELHPTCKPVDLIGRHLRNSSEPGGIVLDPFAGAGSTLLACEQTDRRARIIELERGYCDVIVDRWEELTGKKAKRPRRKRVAAKGKGTK